VHQQSKRITPLGRRSWSLVAVAVIYMSTAGATNARTGTARIPHAPEAIPNKANAVELTGPSLRRLSPSSFMTRASFALMLDGGCGGGGTIGCDGQLAVSIPYGGEDYFGTAAMVANGFWYATYEFTAWQGDNYVTGTITFSEVDCALMWAVGSAGTLDYAVTGWGMGDIT
jgi:hypothetical protein